MTTGLEDDWTLEDIFITDLTPSIMFIPPRPKNLPDDEDE